LKEVNMTRRTSTLQAVVPRPIDRAMVATGVVTKEQLRLRKRTPKLVHPPRVDFDHFRPAGDAVVPPGVKFTQCPAGRDERFTVDPATFCGGEFMADWQAKRRPAQEHAPVTRAEVRALINAAFDQAAAFSRGRAK
jgi:hypothetical protein